MLFPIYTYGSGVLRKVAEPVTKDFPNIKTVIDNMFETMHHADGVGLAAPQVGLSIRLLVIDMAALKDDDAELAKFKITMLNPEILETGEETVSAEEGCLSVPGVHENVNRHKIIKIKYLDADFNEHITTFDDYKARVIQHEYDHLEGNLFTDKVSPIRRQFIKTKLTNIAKGKVTAKYKTAHK